MIDLRFEIENARKNIRREAAMMKFAAKHLAGKARRGAKTIGAAAHFAGFVAKYTAEQIKESRSRKP
jgi:hypothetical protein